MRIALITPGFSASDDDWCIPVLRNLAAGLNARHDVEVYSAAYPAFAREYPVAGVPVKSFGTGRGGAIARYREMRQLAASLRRSHEHRPFDVLHGFWANQGGLLSTLLGRRLCIPSLMTVMAGEMTYEASVDYGKRRSLGGFLGRYAARWATATGTISRYQRDRLAHDEPRLATICLPFGVDTDLFEAQGAATSFPDAVNILMVGSLVPVKGHAEALEALAIVATTHPQAHLHFVGDGVLRQSLRRMAEDRELRSRVTFHGHVEHDLLPAYYRAADFCLLCSHFETSGMVILEAAACGRVTVGSDVGSLADFTPENLRTNPGAAEAIATAITKLIEAPQETRLLGMRALERVRADFTLEHMIGRYAGEYERLASSTDIARSKT